MRHSDPFGLGLVRNAFLRRQRQCGRDAALDVQFAGGVLAVAVNRPGLDAELARDLLGIEVRVNQAQALTLSFGQHRHLFHDFKSSSG